MHKTLFNACKALRFRQFRRKGWALFAALGKVVTIGVLSVATLQSATAASRHMSTDVDTADDRQQIDKEASLDDVEVTGSRAPLAIGQAARMVTVLSREDIQAAPAHSINDLLKMAVGVDVRQRGPLGAQTDVSIRGGTHEQITILLNGINICDPQTGHNTLDLPCDVSDIVRIEIIEGPAGRAYGTSSLVGAINIVTKNPNGETALETRLESGSFGYLSTAARYNYLLNDIGSKGESSTSAVQRSPFNVQCSASYTRSDGYQRAKSGALNSDYSGGKAFVQGGYDGDRISLSWYAGLSVRGYGSNTFWSARYDEQYEHTTKLFTAIQGETKGFLHLMPSIYWNRGYDRFELVRGDDIHIPFNHNRTDVVGIALNSWFDSPIGRTAFGAEMRNEDIVSGNLGEPLNSPHGNYTLGLNRTNLSLHLEHNILLRFFTLSAGFIAVKNTWNGMPLTVYPGLDASLRVGNDWKLYASYNESLRMPSFTELYYSVGGYKADKYLKPEELRAVEFGVKYNTRHLQAKAAVFHHHARNMIDWVMDTREANPIWQSVNHTRINTLGQEVSFRYYLSNLRQHVRNSWFQVHCIELAYCHLHQNKNDQQPYLQSQYSLEYMRHKLTASVRAQLIDRLLLTLTYRWQDRTGSYTTTDGKVKAYTPYSTIDARLAWNNDNYSLYLEGNNLTSYRYVDYGNVRQPGCWVTIGARYKLEL